MERFTDTNLILLSDSYKMSHWKQYPKGTTNVYSYFEARGGEFDKTTFFGLQAILQNYLTTQITMDDIYEADHLLGEHFGTKELFNRAGWEHIVLEHNGYLPVRIKAVPEGTRVKTHNVLMTIENTDPDCFWLTNFLETILSQVWYPTTVASLSAAARDLILKFLKETGTPELVDFKLHDFGFRGVSSVESAGIGGGAHLVNFLGTDTVAALTFLRDHYFANTAAGFSVPASEHSTMTSWGRDNEVDAYRNMIEEYGSSPFYSVVSDSYDLYNAAEKIWGEELKAEVLAAEGTLVVRPDSGTPAVVVPTLLEILGKQFGYTVNSKGFKVLNDKVRVIQGDGMNKHSLFQVLETMKLKGWSADNVTFGMGGGLLQNVNRDTCRFAFKCSAAKINGEWVDVFKEPATDLNKVSKKGRLGLYPANNNFTTRPEGGEGDVLQVVYENGRLVNEQTLDQVRERARLT